MAHLWPANGPWQHKARVVLALALLVGGKLLNIQVPFLFKDIVNKLNVQVEDVEGAVLAVPLALLIGCAYPAAAPPRTHPSPPPATPTQTAWLAALQWACRSCGTRCSAAWRRWPRGAWLRACSSTCTPWTCGST